MSRQEKKNVSILIVDDEPNILLALDFLFTQAGYQVFKAANGNEALQQMSSQQPDILVLDVMMPGLDGFEVARQIRQNEHYAATNIIFLTAKGSRKDRAKGYDSGGEVYLPKPFDNQQLLTIVNEMVEFG